MRKKVENVRKYWRRRVSKLETALARERQSHETTRAAKLVEVNYDPNVPKDYIFMLDTSFLNERGAA